MQAKAFKRACSCSPGFQVDCRFGAQLPWALQTISAPSGSKVTNRFQTQHFVLAEKKIKQYSHKYQNFVIKPYHQSLCSAYTHAIALLTTEDVTFKSNCSELLLIQLHLRPSVKYCQIKALHPFTQQRDVPRKAAELSLSLSFVLNRKKGGWGGWGCRAEREKKKTTTLPSACRDFHFTWILNADSFTNNFPSLKNKAYLIPQNTPIAIDYHSH